MFEHFSIVNLSQRWDQYINSICGHCRSRSDGTDSEVLRTIFCPSHWLLSHIKAYKQWLPEFDCMEFGEEKNGGKEELFSNKGSILFCDESIRKVRLRNAVIFTGSFTQ